jgi:hypothetical protein
VLPEFAYGGRGAPRSPRLVAGLEAAFVMFCASLWSSCSSEIVAPLDHGPVSDAAVDRVGAMDRGVQRDVMSTCGNGECEFGESCASCPADCGACTALCGNAVCNSGENCATCPADCGTCPASCGNSSCDPGETCSSCPADCGTCPASCGNAVCDSGENCSNCPADCGACPAACGDGSCNSGESCASCPADCGACPASCGDGSCSNGESCVTCPADCGACPAPCGDGTCNNGESCATCPADCGACPAACGDGICSSGESCATCVADCGACPAACGDGLCNNGEDCALCPADCGPCLEPRGMYSVFNNPVTAPAAIYDTLVALINATPPGETIRGSMYIFKRVLVADALVAAKNRGVNVRIAVDQYGDNASPVCADAAGGFASCPNFDNSPSTACGKLKAALGTDCTQPSCYVRCGQGSPGQACISPSASGINHEKYFLFSRTKHTSNGNYIDHVVYVSSSNLHQDGGGNMWNNAVIMYGYSTWFQSWVDHFSAQLREQKNIDYNLTVNADGFTVRWSPRATGDHVVDVLRNVTKASSGCFVKMQMADFTSSSRAVDVANQLIRIKALGCRVQVVGNSRPVDFATSTRSRLKAGGVVVRILTTTKTHDKYFLIHARYSGSSTARSLVWTGSHNITTPALRENDENLVKVNDPMVFAAFLANFTDVYNNYSRAW